MQESCCAGVDVPVDDASATSAQLRVGVHSGPIVFGVASLLRPRAEVHGPGAVVAQLLASQCRVGCVLVSAESRGLCRDCEDVEFACACTPIKVPWSQTVSGFVARLSEVELNGYDLGPMFCGSGLSKGRSDSAAAAVVAASEYRRWWRRQGRAEGVNLDRLEARCDMLHERRLEAISHAPGMLELTGTQPDTDHAAQSVRNESSPIDSCFRSPLPVWSLGAADDLSRPFDGASTAGPRRVNRKPQ